MNNIDEKLSNWMEETLNKEVWFVKPRYSVPKHNDSIKVGVLSTFGYDFSSIALGHLSIYHAINRDSECPGTADRIMVYNPIANESGTILPNLKLSKKLTTLERRIPLDNLDVIFVSLTSTDAITTALHLLQLGGVPLRREDRAGKKYPLILAGGPGCCNPEVFANFFDFFCVGDAYNLSKDIVKAIYTLQSQNKMVNASAVYNLVTDNKGLYVPELYDFRFEHGKINNIIPSNNAGLVVPTIVDNCMEWTRTSLFSDGKTAVIVPSQGCKNRCAYCLLTTQGYKEYSVKPMLEKVEQFLKQGISYLIVNAASVTQHTEINLLLDGLSKLITKANHPVKVFLGSICFSELTPEILQKIDKLQAFSHTYSLYTNKPSDKVMALAPEHGCTDLLRCLNRYVDSWRILDAVKKAKGVGVHNFTLYLMVGFPSESVKDRDQTSGLISAIADEIYHDNGHLTLKINPLIPTPGTACQRMNMPTIEEYKTYVHEIQQGVIHRIGEKRYTDQISTVLLPEERLLIESIINRADRRMGGVIEKLLDYRSKGKQITDIVLKSWLNEAGFIWQDLAGSRDVNTILPWDFVKSVSSIQEQRVIQALKNRER